MNHGLLKFTVLSYYMGVLGLTQREQQRKNHREMSDVYTKIHVALFTRPLPSTHARAMSRISNELWDLRGHQMR